MSGTVSANSYDEFLYPTYSFPQTHPDLLGTLAGLFGLPAAPVDRCRVLELGCASGGNLIPLAVAWPGSTFLGVDYSARQTALACDRIAKLGLTNAEVRHASILDVDESWGPFDYIICHGVFSWVPPEVQDGILRVFGRNLAPDGVGYLSYNTLPGWHMRGMIREMMFYHDTWQRDRTPVNRVRQARELLQFLRDAARGEQTLYGQMLQKELDLVQRVPDEYIFHEHLEDHNAPLYFFELNERLTDHQLRFLGEAHFPSMVHENLPPEVRTRLAALAPNLIQMEQYLDFVSNRTFRQSLVCREHHRPDYALSPDRVFGLLVTCPLRPASASVNLAEGTETFTAGGQTVTTSEPLLKAALACLTEAWPAAVPFEGLHEQVRRRLGQPAADLRRELGNGLLRVYSAGGPPVLGLWRGYPGFAGRVGERPTASPLVRLMATEGRQATNLRHDTLDLSEADRHLLPQLDGTRTRAALRGPLLDAWKRGVLNIDRDGKRPADEHEARALLTDVIEQHLRKYAHAAMLLPER